MSSSLRSKIEKKKNKYIHAAAKLTSGSGKSHKDDSDDEKDSVESHGSNVVGTPTRTSKAQQILGSKDGKKDDKDKEKGEKEVWKYEGELNELGEYHGVGRLYSTTTIEFYEGQWVNGKRHGFGTQLFPTGERYQGAWKGGLMDGMGVVSYPTKDTFTGLWELGQRAAGTWSFSNGDTKVTYTEKWTNGTPGPMGELVFSTGGKYVGEVGNAVIGKFTLKNYSVFRHGHGEMIWSDKNRYIGGWKKDARKGFGVFIEASGEKYYGEWTRGKMYTDGTYYEGQHLHDEMRGKGKICVPNGDAIVGEWANNKVTSANFHKGNFDLVPRPMREIFISNVKAIKRTEETAPFISTDKWQAFLSSVEIDPISMPFDLIEASLITVQREKLSEVRDVAHSQAVNPLVKALNRFIYLFNWMYGESSGELAKNPTYALQSAVDDVNSFLAAFTLKIATALNLQYHQNKKLLEILMKTLFQKIHHTLFPLYVEQFRLKDSIIAAKMAELKETTTVTIGVKPKYQLTKTTNGIAPHSPGDGKEANRGSIEGKVLPIIPEKLANKNGRPVPVPHTRSSSRRSKHHGYGEHSTWSTAEYFDRHTKRFNTVDDAELHVPGELTEEGEEVESILDSLAEEPEVDAETGLPKPNSRAKVLATRQNRLASVGSAGARRNSGTLEVTQRKRNRQSMTVTPEMINSSELGAVLKTSPRPTSPRSTSPRPTSPRAIELIKVSDSAPDAMASSPSTPTSTSPRTNSARSDSSPNDFITGARRPSRAVTVDPQDLNAQLALEQTSRTLRADTSLEEMEAEFMQRILPHVPKSVARAAVEIGETSILLQVRGLDSDSESVTDSSSHTARLTFDPHDCRRELPYYAVMLAIDRLSVAYSPIEKLECLTNAGQAIIRCVDEERTDKTQQIVMGAEDKFPILIYALIRSHVKHLHCHANFLSDFVSEHVGDMDSKYRVAELHDALKYIESLEWSVRDKQGTLTPIKLILSNVAWAAKGLSRLKVPDEYVKSQVHADIIVCLSTIFRRLSERVTTPYEPFPIPEHCVELVRKYRSTFFDGAFGKEVGLEIHEDPLRLEFAIQHPLYVYAQLAQVAIAPDAADLT